MLISIQVSFLLGEWCWLELWLGSCFYTLYYLRLHVFCYLAVALSIWLCTVSTAARMVMVVIIVSAIVLFSTQIALLVQAISSRPKYRGCVSLPPPSGYGPECHSNTSSPIGEENVAIRRKYIILYGIFNADSLNRILSQIYTHSIQMSIRNTIVSILSPLPPNSNILLILTRHNQLTTGNMPNMGNSSANMNPYGNGNVFSVKYFIGNCKSEYVLMRLMVEDANAIYILSDSVTSALRVEEVRRRSLWQSVF